MYVFIHTVSYACLLDALPLPSTIIIRMWDMAKQAKMPAVVHDCTYGFCFYLRQVLMNGAHVKTKQRHKLSFILFLIAVHNHLLHPDVLPITKLLKYRQMPEQSERKTPDFVDKYITKCKTLL